MGTLGNTDPHDLGSIMPMSFTNPATDAGPSNLEEAIAFLWVSYQAAIYYDDEFSSTFSSDPSDSYGIQALSESRQNWGVYQYAKTLVESFGGHVGYVTDNDDYTTMVIVTDSAGTELLTYEL